MIRKSPEAYAAAAAIALLAALHKILYASVLVNDDFMHRAYALQVLAGEWPIRDFFDYGMVLMYVTSAVSQAVFGYRLLAEALVIGAVVGISCLLVFDLVRRGYPVEEGVGYIGRDHAKPEADDQRKRQIQLEVWRERLRRVVGERKHTRHGSCRSLGR